MKAHTCLNSQYITHSMCETDQHTKFAKMLDLTAVLASKVSCLCISQLNINLFSHIYENMAVWHDMAFGCYHFQMLSLRDAAMAH